MAASQVFTIPPGVPFLPTLAEALVSGQLIGDLGSDPFALGAVKLYLPTRRAIRAMSSVLSEQLGRAALLPQMIPLGEADEAEFDLAANPMLDTGANLLYPPIPPLERRLILSRLVQKWAAEIDRRLLPLDDDVPFLVPSSPSDAVGLAADLERLMDTLTVEGLPWGEIGAAVEAEHSRYFGLTLDFLRIAAENWPKILAERGLSDPVARLRLLMLAEAERLKRERPADPIVVAGSTGSMPQTAALIAAVAGLPRGAVVLPGLDTLLDARGWDAIESGEGLLRVVAHGHPQAVLHRLLGPDCLNLARDAVATLGRPDDEVRARFVTLSQALRPAETTDVWAHIDPAERAAIAHVGLSGLAVVEAVDEREEALVIATALRETLEKPEATAALITPDRGLALRVSAELLRWGVRAEDSAGMSLASSQAGRFARLVAELAVDIEPARTIALLAHPFVRLGLSRGEIVRGAAALEIGALRGPAPRSGFDGMRAVLESARGAMEHAPRAKRRLREVDWNLAATLLDRLEIAFADFAPSEDEDNLIAIAASHRAACEMLIDSAEDDDEPLDDVSLDTLDVLFDSLTLVQEETLPGRFADYPAFFAALARERIVACAHQEVHPRLRILGLLEARLLNTDRVLLGGLDEGVWPMRTVTDAFLNRPMREKVGLNPPERRIGQSAHDFVQALGHRDAVITRAAKREGAPTVPSRFLQRLRAFVGEQAWSGAVAAGQRLRTYAAALDRGRGPAPPRLTQPKPKADPALFPRRLSVTEIETLVRDPYAIFARHVLGLEPLDPVAMVPGASDRGSLIHDILGKFAGAYPEGLPDLALAEERLFALATNAFAPIADTYPELYAEWFPRYERMAAEFLQWEAERRSGLARVHPEIRGEWKIPLGADVVTLVARADRIERTRDGRYCIVDFKTGAPPSAREVFAGFSPQLTLEAAMLMRGAFEGMTAPAAPELLYVHASGGRRPFKPVELKPPRGDTRTLAEIVAEHEARLRGLLARYLSGEAAYVSRPYPKFTRTYGAYDHLARVLEWSRVGEEG